MEVTPRQAFVLRKVVEGHIERGYEDFERKLNALNAGISVREHA